MLLSPMSFLKFIATIFTVLLLAMTLDPSAKAEPLVVRLAAVSTVPLVLPHDLTLTPDGQYLVATDMGQDRVVLLDPSTLALRHVIGEGFMSYPHDVTFDPQGRLLVADSGNNRILVYRLDGRHETLVETWAGLEGPEGIAVAPSGEVFVALVRNNTIAQLLDGKVVASANAALGMALDRPHDVEVITDAYGQSIIVTDPGNHRLVVFDGTLPPLYEISTWDPPFSEPKYISVGSQGEIFVADQYNNAIRVFSAASEQLGQLAHDEVKMPEGVYASEDRIWVPDTEGGRILLYQRDTSH